MQIKTYVDAIDVIVGLGFLSHGILVLRYLIDSKTSIFWTFKSGYNYQPSKLFVIFEFFFHEKKTKNSKTTTLSLMTEFSFGCTWIQGGNYIL